MSDILFQEQEIHAQEEDDWVWNPSSSGKFTLNSALEVARKKRRSSLNFKILFGFLHIAQKWLHASIESLAEEVAYSR